MKWRRRISAPRQEHGVRLFFATDLHGSTLVFRKALSAPKFYGAQVLVLGGDLTGKRIRRVHPDTAPSVELVEQAEREGIYLWPASEGDANAIEGDPDAERALFADLACQRMRDWLERAEIVLADADVRCLVIGGNDDPPELIELLASHDGPGVNMVEGRVLPLAHGYDITGYGWSNPTPWHTSREAAEETIEQQLRALLEQADDPGRLVLDVHVPPHGTLDECPILDTSVDPPRPLVKGGQVATGSVGSTAVRDLVEEVQPLLVLCGHVHEAHGVARVGQTVVVNAGSEYGDGVLRGALLTLDDGRVAQYQLTSG